MVVEIQYKDAQRQGHGKKRRRILSVGDIGVHERIYKRAKPSLGLTHSTRTESRAAAVSTFAEALQKIQSRPQCVVCAVARPRQRR